MLEVLITTIMIISPTINSMSTEQQRSSKQVVKPSVPNDGWKIIGKQQLIATEQGELAPKKTGAVHAVPNPTEV